MCLKAACAKSGDRVRITGQLIDTVTGAHIWAERFDRPLNDIFELQDEVAASVVGAIEPKLRQSEIERARRKPTESLDAYDLYLRALALEHQYTEEGMREAIALSQKAIAIASSYPPAAALIGWCRLIQRVQSWGSVSDEEVAEAVHLAREAIEAAKDDPDTLWMAAFPLAAAAGEHALAMSAIDRALALNPNSAHAWAAKGYVASYQNQPVPAIAAFDRAIRLSPLDPRGYNLAAGRAMAHLAAGQYEAAIEWADRSVREMPRNALALRIKVVACAQIDRLAEARSALSRLLQLQPELTVSGFRAYVASNFAPELLAVYVDGLRKAGLPEE
jgi:adenylate cyclase